MMSLINSGDIMKNEQYALGARMKLFLGSIVLCVVVAGIFCVVRQRTAQRAVEIFYTPAIQEIPIPSLKNLRSLTEDAKRNLFDSFVPQFPIQAAVKQMRQAVRNPQIVLWFTNHYGQVPREGMRWYKEQIIDQLAPHGATFWLVDLAAWRFLSLKEEELLKCADFVRCMEKASSRADVPGCYSSLVSDSAQVLGGLEKLLSYAPLRSREFFRWLNALPFTLDEVDSGLADRIVRKDLRAGAARFSLRQIGYQPRFLDVRAKRLDKNLLDADTTQVFPLLQYLEGVFYALTIGEQCSRSNVDECSIVFLLPNKEFTYYMVAGDRMPFETFTRTIETILCLQGTKLPRLKIYFFPFSYGKGFYDQPFEEKGPCVSKNELMVGLGDGIP